jgi:hypothetical protein
MAARLSKCSYQEAQLEKSARHEASRRTFNHLAKADAEVG